MDLGLDRCGFRAWQEDGSHQELVSIFSKLYCTIVELMLIYTIDS